MRAECKATSNRGLPTCFPFFRWQVAKRARTLLRFLALGLPVCLGAVLENAGWVLLLGDAGLKIMFGERLWGNLP